MTTYLNDPYLEVVDEYLKDQEWFKDGLFDKAGKFNMPVKYRDQENIQLNKIIAQAADILHGVKLAFPAAAKSQMKSLTRTAEWFTGLIDLDGDQYADVQAGNPRVQAHLDAQIDSLNFNFNKDRRAWFTVGPTSGTDVDYTSDWIPWFGLVSTANSSIGDPADMNGKAGGTAGTQLDLTGSAVMWSSTTNSSIDFVNALVGKSIEAFEAFEDSANGRRMVSLSPGSTGNVKYGLVLHPVIISWMKRTSVYNGEFVDHNTKLSTLFEGMGIELVPDPAETYSTAEDGEVYYRFVADWGRNFLAGTIEKPTFTKWVEVGDPLNPGAEKGLKARYVPLTIPYFDGTNYFKSVVIGKFTFKNDAG